MSVGEEMRYTRWLVVVVRLSVVKAGEQEEWAEPITLIAEEGNR